MPRSFRSLLIFFSFGLGIVIAYQNCAPGYKTRELELSIYSQSLSSEGPSCNFNGQTVPAGQAVLAYQTSSVAAGQNCVKEARECINGNLTGTFAFASCTAQGTSNSCTFNGQTILHGQSATAYQSAEPPSGGACVSEVRNCNNGTLSGSFTFSKCPTNTANSCQFNGQQIADAAKVTAYRDLQVDFGQTCVSEQRTCVLGALTGSYTNSNCSVKPAANCTFNGNSVPHGEKVLAYETSTVPFGGSCLGTYRYCTNGVLSGAFQWPTCAANAPAGCSFNGVNYAHGEKVLAYQTPNVPAGESCLSEYRTCNNGTWSGSFTNPGCFALTNPGCTIGDHTIPHLGSIKLYRAARTIRTCESLTRTCVNGVLQGDVNFTATTCQQETKASCLFYGQELPHGTVVDGDQFGKYHTFCETHYECRVNSAAQQTCDNGEMLPLLAPPLFNEPRTDGWDNCQGWVPTPIYGRSAYIKVKLGTSYYEPAYEGFGKCYWKKGTCENLKPDIWRVNWLTFTYQNFERDGPCPRVKNFDPQNPEPQMMDYQ